MTVRDKNVLKKFKFFLINVFNFLNINFFSYLEVLFAPNSQLKLPYPPVFILGAPRSGSTLLMQVISDSLDVGYLNNFHCKFYGAPSIFNGFLPLSRKKKIRL